MAINFIKNLSQLITGGIGIVDDELVYKDSEGNVKTTATDFEAVEEIPETLDPGQIVFVTETGNLWVGASDDYFPGLDEGTPWPIKGYKEVSFRFDQTGTGDPSISSEPINDLGEITPSRGIAGEFRFTFAGVSADSEFIGSSIIQCVRAGSYFDFETGLAWGASLGAPGGNPRITVYNENASGASVDGAEYYVTLKRFAPKPE